MSETKGLIFAFIAILTWSLSSVLSVHTQHYLTYRQLTFYNFAIPLLLLFIWHMRNLKGLTSSCLTLTKRGHLSLLLSGIGQMFTILFIHVSLKNSPTIEVDVLRNTWPIFLVILSHLFVIEKNDRLDIQSGILLLFAFFGALLVAMKERHFDINFDALPYYLTALASAFWGGAHSYFYRYFKRLPRSETLPHTTTLMIRFFWATISILILNLIYGDSFTFPLEGIVWVLVTALVTSLIAQLLYSYALHLAPVHKVALLAYMLPIFSTFFMILLLDVTLYPTTSLGMAMIILSNIAIHFIRNRNRI